MARIKKIIKKAYRTLCDKLDKTFDPVHYCERVLREAYPEAVDENGVINIPKVIDILEKKNEEMNSLIQRNNQVLNRLKDELTSSLSKREENDIRELTEEEKENAIEFVKSVRERYPGEFENIRKDYEENKKYDAFYYVRRSLLKNYPDTVDKDGFVDITKVCEIIQTENERLHELKYNEHTTEEDIRILAELKEELSRSEREETLNKLEPVID